MALISIIVPVYNEEECLPALVERLLALEEGSADSFEFIFVDDGSTDRSRELIEQLGQGRANFRYLFFSRNFGHEAATTAGIDHASGQAVVIIDADLQDPPEIIPTLIEKWREGNQVVYAQRRVRKGESLMKRMSAWLFYRVMRRLGEVDIPPDTGDFRLVDRRVVAQFRRCREQSRFVRGLMAWTGFRQAAVPYDRDERLAGKTKYNLFKLLMLALDAAVGFSTKPLRFGMGLGLLVMTISVLLGLIVIAQKLFWSIPIPGYALLATGVFLLGGVQIFLIGLVGEYIGRTYRQTQHRPLYIVAEKSDALPPGVEGFPIDDGVSTGQVDARATNARHAKSLVDPLQSGRPLP